MALFLRADLCKAATQQWEYWDGDGVPPADGGWQQTKSGDGWRRPLGSGGGKPKAAEDPKKDKPVSKDPLEDPKATDDPGKPNIKGPKSKDPFNLDPEHHKDTDPLQHYHAANAADRLGDSKVADFHRKQAWEKTKDASPADHYEMAEKLKELGHHDDAAHHSASHKEGLKAKIQADVDKFDEARSKMTPAELAQRGRRDNIARAKAAKRMLPGAKTDLAPKPKEEAAAAPQAPETPREPSIDEKADPQSEAEAPKTPAEDQPQGEEDVREAAAKPGEEEQKHSELEEKYNQGGKLDKQIKAAQVEGQKKATKEFETKYKKYESELAEYKKKTQENEKAQAKHEAEKAKLTDKLEKVKEKLKQSKDKKPQKGSPKLEASKKKVADLNMAIAKHKLEKPKKTDPPEMTKEHQAALKKLEAHRKKEIKGPKNDSPQAQKAYEKRMQKYDAEESQLELIVAIHENKYNQTLDEHDAAYEKELEAHTKKGDELKKQHVAAREAHKKETEKAEAAHAKAMEAWEAKHGKIEQEHKELSKKAKEHAAKKPKAEKLSEPELPPKKPQSPKERMAHEEHTKAASEMASNIESHLKNNKDLTPEQRRNLTDMLERAHYHASVQNTPDKEQSSEMKLLQSQAKKHGAHEHHDVKTSREKLAAQKEAAKQEKAKQQEAKKKEREAAQQEKARAKEARPPKDEVEEAQLHEHKSSHKKKAEELREHLENHPDLTDEEKKHITTAIEHYEAQAESNVLPSAEDSKKSKDIDRAMASHVKNAKQRNKEGGEEEAEPKKDDKSKKPNLLQAWNAGSRVGGQMGAAAANPEEGAGNLADTISIGGKGVVSGGHYLLKDSKNGKTTDRDKKKDKNEKVTETRGKAAEL